MILLYFSFDIKISSNEFLLDKLKDEKINVNTLLNIKIPWAPSEIELEILDNKSSLSLRSGLHDFINL